MLVYMYAGTAGFLDGSSTCINNCYRAEAYPIRKVRHVRCLSVIFLRS